MRENILGMARTWKKKPVLTWFVIWSDERRESERGCLFVDLDKEIGLREEMSVSGTWWM